MRTKAIILLLLAAAVAACSGEKRDGNHLVRIPVVVATAERENLVQVSSYSGTIEGIRQSSVYSRLAETIRTMHVRKGDWVKSDQKLVTFDEGGPGSAVRQAQAVYADARKTSARFDTLYAQGAVSAIERDAHRTAYDVAKANFDAAHDVAVVLSPISGLVTQVDAIVGQQAGIGQALVQIAAIDTVRILIDVPAQEARLFTSGQPVTLHSDVDTATGGTGWVDQVAFGADPNSRMSRVEVLIPNLDHRLYPGMFVNADVELGRRENAISIPVDAIVYRESGVGVFIVQDSAVHYAPIKQGIEVENRIEILDGVQEGQTIVVLGQNNLQDGSLVNPVPQPNVAVKSKTP
jgi:membrane fusion protein (multidrug efflux system)